jgi:hypothetical protein
MDVIFGTLPIARGCPEVISCGLDLCNLGNSIGFIQLLL